MRLTWNNILCEITEHKRKACDMIYFEIIFLSGAFAPSPFEWNLWTYSKTYNFHSRKILLSHRVKAFFVIVSCSLQSRRFTNKNRLQWLFSTELVPRIETCKQSLLQKGSVYMPPRWWRKQAWQFRAVNNHEQSNILFCFKKQKCHLLKLYSREQHSC